MNTTYGYFDWSHNSGFVQSPGYPANYPNEQICRWSIKVAPGYRIFLTVDEADVAHAARSGGLGDMLQVDDGISVKSSRHSSAPWTFLSIGRLVRVLFITDERNSGKGFRLRYERGIEFCELLPFVVIFCTASSSPYMESQQRWSRCDCVT